MSQESVSEDIETIVRKEQEWGVELQKVLGLKEQEYIKLSSEFGEVVGRVWQIKHNEYQSENIAVDPFLLKYLQEMEEQIDGTLLEGDQFNKVQEKDKLEKVGELQKLIQVQQGPLRLLRTQTEIASHLQIAYKTMMESLNQEIYQQMQERADLEDQHFEFDKKLKGLRVQIRDVAERNQKLIKQIENIKHGE